MKLSITKMNLSKMVTMAKRAVGNSRDNAILNNLRLQTSGQVLIITSTDLNKVIVAKTEIDVIQDGSCLVSSKFFFDAVNKIAENKEDIIHMCLEEGKLIMTSGKSKVNVNAFTCEDFPAIPETPLDVSLSLDSLELKKALKEVSIAIGNRDHVQNSIFLSLTGDMPILACTDGKRLAQNTLKSVAVPEKLKKDYIIPSSVLPDLYKFLDEGESITMGLVNYGVFFQVGIFTLITRLIDGRFPDYKRVIPTDKATRLKVDRKELLNAVKFLSLAHSKDSDRVKFQMGHEGLKLSSEDAEGQQVEREIVNFELEGIEGDINFSAEFLADFLNVVGDKKVILDTKKYNLPGLMTIDNPESNFKYVIMPIK